MRYTFRTLLITMTLAPPALAGLWFLCDNLSLFALEFLFPVLALPLAILAVAAAGALMLVAIFTPGVAIFYLLSAVLRLFRRTA